MRKDCYEVKTTITGDSKPMEARVLQGDIGVSENWGPYYSTLNSRNLYYKDTKTRYTPNGQ